MQKTDRLFVVYVLTYQTKILIFCVFQALAMVMHTPNWNSQNHTNQVLVIIRNGIKTCSYLTW